jgi:plasmid stabilization system protein ParE
VTKPRLVLSDAAIADVVEQADWYRVQSGAALAKRWERAVTSALLRILKNPAAGTRCTFRPVDLRDVRRATIGGFPSICSFTDSRRPKYSFSGSFTAPAILENLF